ncbi:sensor histidine kinase [Kitasatospora sp. NBC_00315]|uniref:sensor histidine kinase n=1 Tax=Kitasatospora sp. NBC_00315 TaxID=2975963 RepID=UPI00324514D2
MENPPTGRTAPARLATLLSALARPSADRTPQPAGTFPRWPHHLPYLLAVGAAASLLPTGITVLTHDYGLNPAVAAALAVAQSVPLVLAVSRPLPAWWIIGTADLLTALLLLAADRTTDAVWPWPATSVIGYCLLMVPLSLREPRRTLLAVWLTTVAGSLTMSLVAPADRFGGDNSLLVIALSGAVLVFGGALRERAEARRLLTEQEQISESERGQRTLLEERARIARELHDVVAHHMSVIAVQAASAPYRLTGVPEEAVAEFTAIAGTARESLTEMRRLLGVLRNEGSGAETAPQPGLAQLPQLLETVGRAGVSAELTVHPEAAGPLPAAVELSAYRIVQEALANVVRHAPGARAWVSLALQDGRLLVTVVNAAPTTRSPSLEHAAEGTGHGLTGMRERVRLLDGRLDTGPLPDGGFKVAAALPTDTPGESAA